MAETDVLIIGAGAAGLTAALAAHAGGARVSVIDKGAQLGGTAAISGGVVWIANNPRMQEAGMADSAEEALAYFTSLDHGEMDPAVLGAFISKRPMRCGSASSRAIPITTSTGPAPGPVADGRWTTSCSISRNWATGPARFSPTA
jgi:monoamine oxidase